MNTKQFIQFKNDFINAVKFTKLVNKYPKAWWNEGFKSEEEYKAAQAEIDKEKVEIGQLISKNDKGHFVVIGSSFLTHWAYYCAKHRLDSEERKTYVENQWSKLRQETKDYYLYLHWGKKAIDKVEEILSYYETLVCSDGEVA